MATYTIDGRLTKDGVMVSSQKCKSILKFSIACKSREKTHFYDCVMFGERSERLLPFMKKGRYLIVTGEPDWREYKGTTYETVIVDRLSFVGNAEEKEEPTKEEPVLTEQDLKIAEEVWGKKKTTGPEDFDDADIPF